MRVPEGLESVLSIDPEIMHGELCFRGTRVPVDVFLGNQQEGMSVEEFLEHYPSIKRDYLDVLLAWQRVQFANTAELDLAS